MMSFSSQHSETKHYTWPDSKFSLAPGESCSLPIKFRPPSEDVFVGQLCVDTGPRTHRIELAGTGREALLLYLYSPPSPFLLIRLDAAL